MTLQELNHAYDAMQMEYGAPNLRSIYYGGCMESPDLCFVFMNPTGRNIASDPAWTGIRAPWVGTKNIWDLFLALGRFDEGLYREIKARKSSDWTPSFAAEVYAEVARNRLYLTNLGKCTLADAAPVSNQVYNAYLPLLEQELSIIDPKAIILFGNQVSSIFLRRSISVSQCRKQRSDVTIQGKIYPCFPVYYPVGNGRVNIGKSIEDLNWICEHMQFAGGTPL